MLRKYYKLNKMKLGLYIKLGVGVIIAAVWALVFSGILTFGMIKITLFLMVTGAYILFAICQSSPTKDKANSVPHWGKKIGDFNSN